MQTSGEAVAIRAEGLVKAFGGLRAVDGLSLTVRAGEIYGLVGPDGAGKTTALRLLASLMRPSEGRALVEDLDTVKDAGRVKERIGYMSQRFGLYPDLTVLENLRFYADVYGVPRKSREERIAGLLETAHLSPFGKRAAGNLSGGMKQKLALACALLHTPRVLFLDEPTNGVDPVSRRDFWRILHDLPRKGAAVLLATSYLDEAERCTRVGLLSGGRLLAEGTPGEIRALFRGTLLEVRAAEPRRAARLLREGLGGIPVDIFGDRIHVAAADAGRAEADIPRLLAGSGLTLLGLRPVEPSLEDVFLSLLAGGKP